MESEKTDLKEAKRKKFFFCYKLVNWKPGIWKDINQSTGFTSTGGINCSGRCINSTVSVFNNNILPASKSL